MSSPVAVIGATGLVGANILSTLLAKPALHQPVYTITRRDPGAGAGGKEGDPAPASLRAAVEADTGKWAGLLSGLEPAPAAVISALGTTRAAAGGLAAQWKIDHDLNVELARAAKAAGARTFVFVSSGGTRGALAGLAPYSRMKNGVEDAVRGLGFDQAVILKPGLILGRRREARAAEGALQAVVGALGRLSAGLHDAVGQDALVIARAAVAAARLAADGKAPDKYWVLEAADIIRLGRTDWPDEEGEGGEKKPAQAA